MRAMPCIVAPNGGAVGALPHSALAPLDRGGVQIRANSMLGPRIACVAEPTPPRLSSTLRCFTDRPKDMKTDSQLRHDVITELSCEPSVNAAKIDVEVTNGIVTLAGHVESYTERLSAARAVLRVSGVLALAFEDAKLFGSNGRNDADIARSAQDVLQWTTYATRNPVRVAVQGGQVTLSGELDWDWQRQGAVSAVGHLVGVVNVNDQIVIKPQLSSRVVHSEIEAASSTPTQRY
jgi:osmotically-inducible protein OsmY